jgi:hypothetical protein
VRKNTRQDDPFQRALDAAHRAAGPPDGDLAALAPRPHVRANVDFGQSLGAGGEARFDLAMNWTGEPAEPPGQGATDLSSSDTPAEIADELGLGDALNLSQLMSRWREFVWRNHPDRQPSEVRQRANARVAIANALYHQRRRELTKGR